MKNLEFQMANETYDKLRVVQLIIPLLGTLYFGLAQIWGFPFGEEVVGSLTCIETFLSGVLKISNDNYNKGDE